MIPPGAIVAVFLVLRALTGGGKGNATAQNRPWSPSRGSENGVAVLIGLRFVVLLVAMAFDADVFDDGAPRLAFRAIRFLVIVALMFPGFCRALLVHAGWARITELHTTLLPPFAGRREGDATIAFYAAWAALRSPSRDRSIARYERILARVALPGPIHLAARAMIDALRGDLDEARAKLDDVLALDGRADPPPYHYVGPRVPPFVRLFAEREVVFHHLARGNYAALAELPIYARGGLPRFAAAAAERLLDRATAPGDATLVLRWLLSTSRYETYPLLRRALAAPKPGRELGIDAIPPDADLAALVAHAFRLRRIGSERLRIAEANALSNELATRLDDGEVDDVIADRLVALRGTADPARAVDELVTWVESCTRRALADVRIVNVDLVSDAVSDAYGEQLDAAYARLDDQIREFLECRSDAMARAQGRAARAYRQIRLAHAHIVAADPYARETLFVGPLAKVWNRAVEIGDQEGNWILAFVVFQFLLAEAQALGRKDMVPLKKNRAIYA